MNDSGQGGYKIVNLHDVSISSTAVTISGVYDELNKNFRKAIMLSGLNLNGTLINDVFVDVLKLDNQFVISIYNVLVNNILMNYKITVTSADAVTLTIAQSNVKGDKGDPGTGATVVQATGTSTENVMSQNACTTNFATKTEVNSLKEDLTNINERFEERGSTQLFDKDNTTILDNAYINSSNTIISFDGYSIITIKVDGSDGDSFAFKCFDDDITTSALALYASNSVPVIGGSVSQKSQYVNASLKRGRITLDDDYTYLHIMLSTTDSTTSTSFANKLVVCTGISFPSEYLSFYNTVVESIEKRIDDVNERFETEETQLFNKNSYTYLADAYINGSNNIVSYSGYGIITLKVNGTDTESFAFKMFNVDSITFSNISLYASNSIPTIGGSVSQKSNMVNISNKRGYIQLSADYDYIHILFDNASSITDIANGLVVVNGSAYPSEYIEYATSYLSVAESVEKRVPQYWKNKTIWWCGTSIPEGVDPASSSEWYGKSYPQIVADMLGATVINKSIGSSMCRANTRLGAYADAMKENIIRSLTATSAEKEDLITNWSTYVQVMRDPTATLSSDDEAICRASTYERLLLPYLDGTYDMPDLFVIDHGHNDWKYTLSDGTTDIGLAPTTTSIASGELGTDTYMTANSNAKLIETFGEISHIPSGSLNDFIASVNRNCFIGSVNFLCTLILKYNPRARIVFIGNIDNSKTGLTSAQETNADSWCFPIIKMWQKLGFGLHYIPSTYTYWESTGTTDLTQKNIYCKDNIHPHSDTTGQSIEMCAKIIADGINHIVC